jgi:hypothetical protein
MRSDRMSVGDFRNSHLASNANALIMRPLSGHCGSGLMDSYAAKSKTLFGTRLDTVFTMVTRQIMARPGRLRRCRDSSSYLRHLLRAQGVDLRPALEPLQNSLSLIAFRPCLRNGQRSLTSSLGIRALAWRIFRLRLNP